MHSWLFYQLPRWVSVIFHISSQIIHWRHGYCSFIHSFIPSLLHYLFAFTDLFVMEIQMNPFGWNTLSTHEIRYEQNTLNDGVDLWWFCYFSGFAQWSLLSLFNTNFRIPYFRKSCYYLINQTAPTAKKKMRRTMILIRLTRSVLWKNQMRRVPARFDKSPAFVRLQPFIFDSVALRACKIGDGKWPIWINSDCLTSRVFDQRTCYINPSHSLY